MKLTNKGKKKAISIAWNIVHGVPDDDEEFAPEDFKDVVVLTSLEAEICCRAIDVLIQFSNASGLKEEAKIAATFEQELRKRMSRLEKDDAIPN